MGSLYLILITSQPVLPVKKKKKEEEEEKGVCEGSVFLRLARGWPGPWLGLSTPLSTLSAHLSHTLYGACRKGPPDLFPIKLADLPFVLGRR